MEKFFDFMHSVGKLKDTKREGWVIKQVLDSESVADHCFRTAILVMVCADPHLDVSKCIKMALIHDLGESGVGDITPHDHVTDGDKHEKERSAVSRLFPKEILKLWDEYTAGETHEAKFVYEMDKVEMLIQAYEYEAENRAKGSLDEFWDYVKKRVKSRTAVAMVRLLESKRKSGKSL
ncbi:MAG: HD domain-containing protein [Candidatus Woesearchaeota archaeon]